MAEAAWHRRIDRFYDQEFDDADPQGSIARMRDLVSGRPEGDAEALFELGGVHDALGLENEAIPLYRRAIEAGLEGADGLRVSIQLASTLRNVGNSAEAVGILESMPDAGVDEGARRAFLALALHDAGRHGDALRTALIALIPTLGSYERALTDYAAELPRSRTADGPARSGGHPGRHVRDGGAGTLDDELDLIVGRRERDNMQPTIDALLPLLAAHPVNARVLYEVGGAYDTAGHEDIAQELYEKALAAGLEGDLLRRCYLQYGSTLRNLGEYGKSLEVLGTARATFPDSPALAVFEAITLQAAGRTDESIASLLDLVVTHVSAPDIERYKPAISGNAAHIRSMEEPRDPSDEQRTRTRP